MFRLILVNLRRHALRTILTGISVGVAFLLYAYLVAIGRAFVFGADLSEGSRLIVRNAIGIRLLPLHYEERIEDIEGVVEAMPLTMFGGIQGERRTTLFNQFPVWPGEFRRIWPEFQISDATLEAWKKNRRGAIVGRTTAERLDLAPGDRLVLRSPLWAPKKGESWEFEIVGIYEGATRSADETHMFFQQDYFDENRRSASEMVLMFMVRIERPAAGPVIVEKIDALFANSDAETRTESEAAFLHSIAFQIGNVGAIATAIMTAVFFTILLVAGNTMMQSVRERTTEIGLLKALGFTDIRIVALVVAESLLVAFVGGGAGLLAGGIGIAQGDPTGGMLPRFYLNAGDFLVGMALIFGLGLVAGFLPALEASSLSPITALQKE